HLWSGHATTIAERNTARDADKPSPSARAHDGANLLAMKEPRKSIATRTGQLVYDHHFWSVNGHRGPRNVFPFARGNDREQLALELLRVEVGNLAAGVAAFINDEPVLVQLSGELFVEGDDAGKGGVGDM